MRQLEQIHTRPVLPAPRRPIVIRQLKEVVQLARNHLADPFPRLPHARAEVLPGREPDRPAALGGAERGERFFELGACGLEVLEISDELGELGESGGGGEAGEDGLDDVVDEETVEGLAEEGVDVAVVLRDAVHEEVEALDEVPDLIE